jgi:hypothetical protein
LRKLLNLVAVAITAFSASVAVGAQCPTEANAPELYNTPAISSDPLTAGPHASGAWMRTSQAPITIATHLKSCTDAELTLILSSLSRKIAEMTDQSQRDAASGVDQITTAGSATDAKELYLNAYSMVQLHKAILNLK